MTAMAVVAAAPAMIATTTAAAASPLAVVRAEEAQLRNRDEHPQEEDHRPRRGQHQQQQQQRQQQQQQRRELKNHGWYGPPHAWESSSTSSSSSGKSGKSGGGGGKSGKSGNGSGKSGKSGNGPSSSSGSGEGWHGAWGGVRPGWYPGSSSSSGSSSTSSSGSAKSGKSGGGGGSKGSKGRSSSSSSHDDGGWGWDHHHNNEGWHGAWWPGSSSSGSGKSGKSGGGSGKSGKSGHSSSSSSSSEDHPHGSWHNNWSPLPWGTGGNNNGSSSSSSKSGKDSKSGKGSKSSSSTSGDWIFYLHAHPHTHEESSSTTSADSSSPGICAPGHDHGGLECDVQDGWDYCTEPGAIAECRSGYTCYDKELCPEFAPEGEHPVGVCDAHGKGLECTEVTTYCTKPGHHGECGHGRKCHDAGLCGHGGDGDYDGVCGSALHGGKHSGLDCLEVTTKCTAPGEKAECAYGAGCFDADLCHDTGDHAGFCGKKGKGGGGGKEDCDDISTYCDRPGEGGQCTHGSHCLDIDVCAPTSSPVTTKPPTPSPTVLALDEVCFIDGKIVDCAEWASLWGGDGHGDGWSADGHDNGEGEGDGSAWDGDGHGDDGSGDGKGHGEVITVPYTYTVDTDGTVDPESVVKPVENAILDDVADYIDENEEFGHFTGKITAAPGDEIADNDYCGDGNAVRCTVINGEMSVIVSKQDIDSESHDFDECEVLKLIKESMEDKDYSKDVDGVSGAKYRNSDVDCGKIIAGAAIVVQAEDDSLSAGAAFGMLAAAAALLALLFLLAGKFKRKSPPPTPVRDDISLISNSLNGSMYDDKIDPYANTIDVHKCTSIYCDCNKGGLGTTFLPAPKCVNVDIAKTMMDNGISPTAVDQVDGKFFNPSKDEDDSEADQASGLKQQDLSLFDQASDIEQQSDQVSSETRGSIMRVPIRSQLDDQDQDRPLTPVNEIAHDSEIDTELESVADDNDYSTVPPPPPLSSHPAYGQESGKVQPMGSNDEISI
eukprot:CAMPEP_0181118984 /NCGR_PEP_ID=MMETSP1071-20121207/23365_1 /TAXON_ID=35127 /ORGANISM="Thalassiosira sp., Strain NH16" /LENGTH=995 /DNA_ID=CAMNT_0023203511 /DNA_START=260 /DNA_END=3247 /DNA_ORIENTATION=-